MSNKGQECVSLRSLEPRYTRQLIFAYALSSNPVLMPSHLSLVGVLPEYVSYFPKLTSLIL